MKLRVWLLLALLGFSVPACGPPPSRGGEEKETDNTVSVQPGSVATGVLPPHGSSRLTIDLQRGEVALFEIEQHDVDVELTLFDPSGRREVVFDTPTGRMAQERLCFVARSNGLHEIRLAAVGDRAGAYELRLGPVRTATSADRDCDAASRLFAAAMARLSVEGVSESVLTDCARAQALWVRAGELLLAAVAARETGSLHYAMGRGAAAERSFREALALLAGRGHPALEVSLQNRLGLALFDRGEVTRAGDELGRALALARASGNVSGEASALNNLALIDVTTGEIHRGIERYREVLPIWQRLGKERDLARTEINLADAYARVGHHRQALHQLADALEAARRTGDRTLEAEALTIIGWVHHLSSRPERGVPALRRAVALRRHTGDRNGEAAALDRLGTVLRSSGQPAAALAAYRASMAISEAGGSSWDAATTAANVGCLLQEWGRTEGAMIELTRARRHLAAAHDLQAVAHVEFCLAAAERGRGNQEAALAHAESALSLVDRMRTSARRRGAGYRPIRLWQEYAELRQELLMARYRTTGDPDFAVRAFETGDLTRARSLFELVIESRVGVRAAVGERLLQRERDVQGRLNAVAARLRSLRALGSRGPEVTDLERTLGEISIELEEVRTEIRRADPRYAAMAAPRAVRVEELQTILGSQTVLLSYSLGDERSYLFIVDQGGFRVRNLPSRSLLEAHAAAFHRSLQQGVGHSHQQRLTGGALGRLLLPPGVIAPDARHLLIVASGSLHYVPFAALPSPASTRGDGAERFLVDDFDIRYLPSVTVLSALRRRDADRVPPAKTVAVFADPVYSSRDPRVRRPAGRTQPGASTAAEPSGESQRLGPLPRLPASRREARRILSLVPPTQRFSAIGFAATKHAALGEALRDYRFVHFASHAVIDERYPDLSKLVLSRCDRRGRAIDGELHLHEIFGLRLTADLVVLSGCRTALGPHLRGEGLLGLTRGFLHAGASQVLVTLWSVDDEATAELMSELYGGVLERGQAPAAALRSAQLWMRSQPRWEAPRYWSAFVLQGDDR